MLGIIARSWRQALAVVALVGLDLVLSLPIMGATYRPFSWTSIASADVATLYPVIQNLTLEGDRPRLAVQVTAGARYTLQRSTNLLDATGWTEMGTTTATGRMLYLVDTNPVSRSVYYRVRHVLDDSP